MTLTSGTPKRGPVESFALTPDRIPSDREFIGNPKTVIPAYPSENDKTYVLGLKFVLPATSSLRRPLLPFASEGTYPTVCR
jgi:hypothetical protein